ncbi:hypothetical protein C8N26_1500 [Tenacibaculum lutimaris]|uniref:Uncharacterized protein n=1 Tax=Tenacibaculum lutimaris TaxID=285258 RepID=A0A420E159_9FLAO|nr:MULTISPECIES: hypothetical protein [Tenacibaculum]RKF03871.1 hypothetical protein C8N26_1500 [Tenacibaculum lutimaris]
MIIQNPEVKNLLDEFNLIVKRAENIAIFTRDIGLQKEEIEKLENFSEKADKLKNTNKDKYSEDELNLVLCLLLSANALRLEISMIVCLKNNEMNFAWGHLVEAQTLVSVVARNHPFSDGEYLNGFSSKLNLFEKLFFPRMMFASTGAIIKKTRCNICGLEYEECNHMKGRMYSGELCVREIHEAELEEVSMVENPANKLCRQLQVEFDGKMVDTFTLVE